MNGEHHISEDYFIPDGLEFRDEYLHSAMQIYQRERKKALWLKRTVIMGIAALFISGALFWLSDESVKNQYSDAQEQGTGRATEEGGNKKSNSASHSERANTVAEIKSISSSVNDEDEMHTNEKREIDNSSINEKETALNAEADGQGGSLSSGSELPDPKPLKIIEKNVNQEQRLKDKIMLQSITSIEPIHSDNSFSHSDSNMGNGDSPMISPSYLMIQSIVPKVLKVAAQLKELKETTPLTIPTNKKFKPYLVLGFNPLSDYGSGWKRFKIDPYIALGIDHRLGNGWKVGADARYYFISGLSHPLTFEQTIYGQGFETNQTTIYTDRLHYAGVHLTAQKKFGRHQASLGYGADYLVTGRNSIENRLYSSFENVSGNASSTSGYVLGFRNFNHSISLGYDYWMGKNKAIGLNYQLGLTDVSANKYFTQGQFDRNSMLSVHLKMYLR